MGDGAIGLVKKLKKKKHHQEMVNINWYQKDPSPNLILMFSCPDSDHVDMGLLSFKQRA